MNPIRLVPYASSSISNARLSRDQRRQARRVPARPHWILVELFSDLHTYRAERSLEGFRRRREKIWTPAYVTSIVLAICTIGAWDRAGEISSTSSSARTDTSTPMKRRDKKSREML
ncbi:hypothetical protein BOTBODRAFT_642155 [Botryobasidium botryosum FD-172 SS1]|uniref:Uncharacterized protein n=1 Tax=Botryobasidium botryosum (strain FD-172 SS1) TaxID=930990 RepID=A0A067MCT7_BOTB1|nr:hypothetical protein BOTBODRAFT_642155 [Botryobasidium botryosum FD-172 SS1]